MSGITLAPFLLAPPAAQVAGSTNRALESRIAVEAQGGTVTLRYARVDSEGGGYPHAWPFTWSEVSPLCLWSVGSGNCAMS